MTRYRAYSYASGTIINAIAAGKGSAFAIDLKTEAEVELMKKWGSRRVEVCSDSCRDTSFAELCVRKVLEKAGKRCGAKVSIKSDIPTAQGLSSSSAVSNAVILAASAACRIKPSDEELINLGVNYSIEAGVSITGALDDASASFFGGITVTDNLERKILKRERFPHGYSVLVLVSEKKQYTGDINKKRVELIKTYVNLAYSKAVEGDFLDALTLNGILYSSILGYNPEPIYDMLANGASAAGLSGTGPAFIGVVEEDLSKEIKKSLEKYGRVIETRPRNSGAGVMVIPP